MKHLPDFKYEKSLWKKGYVVIGVDEVGRGALAGPLYVGAVCFNNIFLDSVKAFPPASARLAANSPALSRLRETLPALPPKKINGEKITFASFTSRFSSLYRIENLGINDSKRLSPVKRRKLVRMIKKYALADSVCSVSVSVINRLGIVKATQIAIRKAIKSLMVNSYWLNGKKLFVLVDAFYVKYLRGIGLKNQKAIIRGDGKSISIAAASIIAKVERDQNMVKLDHKYPIYFWRKNKGYGTRQHVNAIKKFGRSKLHRDLYLRKILQGD